MKIHRSLANWRRSVGGWPYPCVPVLEPTNGQAGRLGRSDRAPHRPPRRRSGAGGAAGRAGIPTGPVKLAPRIAAVADTDTVLVTEVGGQVVGMASLHVAPLFNEGRSRGRITALVVVPDQRGHGICRHLLEAMEAAKRRGCGVVERTSRPFGMAHSGSTSPPATRTYPAG